MEGAFYSEWAKIRKDNRTRLGRWVSGQSTCYINTIWQCTPVILALLPCTGKQNQDDTQ